MFLYKENNDKVIRRRGFGNSRQLEGYNRGSAHDEQNVKGYVQTPLSSSHNNNINIKQSFPTFDAKIVAGKIAKIYHDQLPENSKRNSNQT